MSENRQKCLKSIYDNSGSEVILIDKTNIADWASSDDFHPAYNLLSCTHKADYLRCYLMHRYGGGYSDIKYCNFDWKVHFSSLELNNGFLMSGYSERSPFDIASDQQLVRNSYRDLPGMCQFIFKPKTELTYMWINNVHQYLDSIHNLLTHNPGTYHPRAIYRGAHDPNLLVRLRYIGSKYPLRWNSLLGRILHPIAYAFKHKIDLTMPYISISTSYR